MKKSSILFFMMILISCGSDKEKDSKNQTTEQTPNNQQFPYTYCSVYKSWGSDEIRYCHTQLVDPSTSKEGLLIAFHGLGGNEKAYMEKEEGKEMIKEINRDHMLVSNVLTLSFGKQWSLAEPGKLKATKSLIQKLEEDKKIDTKKVIVTGESMGGHNSLAFTKSFPNIKATAVFCPAVIGGVPGTNTDPFFSIPEPGVKMIREKFKTIFHQEVQPSFEKAMTNFSTSYKIAHSRVENNEFVPLALSLDSNPSLDPKLTQQNIFIHANASDPLPGFNAGAKEFHNLLKENGDRDANFELMFKETPGVHCVNLPIQEAANFYKRALAK